MVCCSGVRVVFWKEGVKNGVWFIGIGIVIEVCKIFVSFCKLVKLKWLYICMKRDGKICIRVVRKVWVG